MKICLVGQGAFGKKHLDGLKRIKDAEVISIYGRTAETTEAVADKYGIPHWTTNFEEALARPGLEAVILTSPTQVHAQQAIQCMRAGKHVVVDKPFALTLAEARGLAATSVETGRVLSVFQNRRWDSDLLGVVREVGTGRIGTEAAGSTDNAVRLNSIRLCLARGRRRGCVG